MLFRKLSLVAVTVASLGAALAPTSASAWGGWHGGYGGWHGGYGGWHHGWWGGPRIVVGGPAYYATAMAAAMSAVSSRRPGDPAGRWSTAATD
jgi:hypothetical protein